MSSYLANICPFGHYVVNGVRQLADDSLSHNKCLNARHTPDARHCYSGKRSERLSKTNFERKKKDGLSMRSEVINT